VLVAITTGIAMSGKYIGIVTLPIAIGIVAWNNRRSLAGAMRPCAWVVGLALAVFLVLNAPLLSSFYRFFFGLRQEVKHVIDNSGGLYYPLSSTFYLEALVKTGSPLVLAFYCWSVFRLILSGRQSSAMMLVVGLLPIGYLAMLQLSPVKAARYELPAMMVIGMVAAFGVTQLFLETKSWVIRAVAVLAISAALAGQLMGTYASRTALLTDSRSQMVEWIRNNLRSNAVVAEGRMSGVEQDEVPLTRANQIPTKVLKGYYTAADLGSLAELRAAGVTHVLVADSEISRYFSPMVQVDTKDAFWAPRVARDRAFHTELFKTGRLVHQIAGSTPVGTYFSPSLWLFDIRPRRADDHRHAAQMEPPAFRSLQD
jgi:hypothetical protein